jgi:hypothetical protein
MDGSLLAADKNALRRRHEYPPEEVPISLEEIAGA